MIIFYMYIYIERLHVTSRRVVITSAGQKDAQSAIVYIPEFEFATIERDELNNNI